MKRLFMTSRSARCSALLLCIWGLQGCRSEVRQISKAPTSVSAVTTSASQTTPLLDPTASRAQAAGAGPLQVVATGVRGAGETLTGLAAVPEHRCALIYARSGPSVPDLDLHAFSDDGTQYGSDEGPDAHPTVLVCAEDTTVRLFLSAKVAQGTGLVAMGLHDVPSIAKTRVSAAVVTGEQASKIALDDRGWPTLDDDIADHLRALGGEWRDLRRVALPVDARISTRFDAKLEHGQCLSALAFPDDPFLALDLQVSSAEGRVLARGAEFGAQRRAVLCNDGPPILLGFQVRPQTGQGYAVVALSVSSRSADDSRRGAIILGSSQVPPSRSDVVLRSIVEIEQGRLLAMNLASPGCRQYQLVDKDGQVSPRAALSGWDNAGKLLGEISTSLGVPLMICHVGPLRFEIDGYEFSPHAQLLASGVALIHPVFLEYPLASSRADTQLQLLRPPSQLVAETQVEALRLDEGKMFRAALKPLENACSLISVGTTDSMGWLDLRVAVPGTETPHWQSQGSTSAGVVVCTQSAPALEVQIRRAGPATGAVLLKAALLPPPRTPPAR